MAQTKKAAENIAKARAKAKMMSNNKPKKNMAKKHKKMMKNGC